MGMLGLLKGIKLRFPRRRKVKTPVPVFTLQELDHEDEEELLGQLKEGAEQDVVALQNALRGLN